MDFTYPAVRLGKAVLNKQENAIAAYIALKCLELRTLACRNDMHFLARLLEFANLEASLAHFDLETHVRDERCQHWPELEPGGK